MEQRLRTYALRVETIGPLYVGSGQTIGKKEYIFVPQEKRVYIPDLRRMQQFLSRAHLLERYEDYLLHDSYDFLRWLRNNQVPPSEYKKFTAYTVASGDAVFENRGKKEILTFQKDAYGCPYVPGSSVKGALRTILLGAEILSQPQKYSADGERIQQADLRVGRTRMLKNEMDQLEQKAFYSLKRDEKRLGDAVNDSLCGLRISDSKPLRVEDLVLCQKVDVTTDGMKMNLPILRECIRPGVTIEFRVTIDPQQCNLTPERLLQAVQRFLEYYNVCFRNAFPQIPKLPQQRLIYLGGGCGYAAKTITYPLLGTDGYKRVSCVIDATLPREVARQHGHTRDTQKGVSPHMLKCTRYNGNIYEMGACRLSIL
jgi:CRISPR-associated protein Csm5